MKTSQPPVSALAAQQHTCLEPGRARVLAARWQGAPARMQELRRRLLLIHPGEVVYLGEADPDLDALLASGSIMGEPVIVVPGRISQCHTNAATFYRNNRSEGAVIATGYVVDTHDPGIWRQHSWAMLGGRIVETTHPRAIYWGVRISGPAADAWAARRS